MVHLRPSWSPYAQSRLDSRHHGSLQLRYDNGCRQVDRTIQHTLLETAKVRRGRKSESIEVWLHFHRRYHISILLVLIVPLGPLRDLSYRGSYWQTTAKIPVTCCTPKNENLHGSVPTFRCLQFPLDQAMDLLPAASSHVLTVYFFISSRIIKTTSTS